MAHLIDYEMAGDIKKLRKYFEALDGSSTVLKQLVDDILASLSGLSPSALVPTLDAILAKTVNMDSEMTTIRTYQGNLDFLGPTKDVLDAMLLQLQSCVSYLSSVDLKMDSVIAALQADSIRDTGFHNTTVGNTFIRFRIDGGSVQLHRVRISQAMTPQSGWIWIERYQSPLLYEDVPLASVPNVANFLMITGVGVATAPGGWQINFSYGDPVRLKEGERIKIRYDISSVASHKLVFSGPGNIIYEGVG